MNRPVPATLPPLVKTLTVRLPPDDAFRHFTAEIAAWWSLQTHSIGESRAESVVLEERVGGRIFERIRDGTESTWGTITAFDPPRHVAFT